MDAFETILTNNLTHIKQTCKIRAFRYRLDYSDLLGDTLEKLWRFRDRFRFEDGDVGFKKWVSFVIHSVSVDTWRKDRRQETTPLEYTPHLEQRDQPYEEQQFIADVMGCVQRKFPEHYFAVFCMVRNGFKYKEIADTLSINECTIRTIVRKVRLEMIDQRKLLQAV